MSTRSNNNNNYPLFGIKNFKSTCFANSVFNTLCSIPQFVDYMKEVEPTDEMKYTKALKEMLEPFLTCKSKGIQDKSIDPPASMREIITHLQRESGQNQMDAGEFYSTIIDNLNSECKKIDKEEEEEDDGDEWEEVGKNSKTIKTRTEKCDNTKVSEAFRGMMRTLTTTMEGKKQIQKAVMQPFFVFSLPIQKGKETCSSVKEALNLALTVRKSDNELRQKISFEEVPKILVLQLNRFIYDREKLDVVKITEHISYEETLTIKVGKKDYTYNLLSVIEHRGNQIRRGHYVCYVKRGNKWYYCNDENIYEEDVDKVLKKMAYLLVYSQQ